MLVLINLWLGKQQKLLLNKMEFKFPNRQFVMGRYLLLIQTIEFARQMLVAGQSTALIL